MSIGVIVIFEIKSDKRDSFLEIMNSVLDNLPDVSGCNSVFAYNSIENNNIFTLVENWDSVEVHKVHIANVISSGNWDFVLEHLVCDPKAEYHENVAG